MCAQLNSCLMNKVSVSSEVFRGILYSDGDNGIQNFNLGWYIVRYMVGNLVLWRLASGAVKCDFRAYNQ